MLSMWSCDTTQYTWANPLTYELIRPHFSPIWIPYSQAIVRIFSTTVLMSQNIFACVIDTPEVNDTGSQWHHWVSFCLLVSPNERDWFHKVLRFSFLSWYSFEPRLQHFYVERFKVWKGFLIKGLLIIGYIFLLKTILVLYKKQLYICWRFPVERNASG